MNFQRPVLIFSGVVIFMFIMLIGATGYKQGWFAATVTYQVRYEKANGLYEGTPVTVLGLRAGRVTSVELDANNQIIVTVSVLKKFAEHIRKDSVAELGRPFIIGEKELAISPGSPKSPKLAARALMDGRVNFEITDLMSGGQMSAYMNTFNKLLDQLQQVVEGQVGQKNVTLVDLYKQAYLSLAAIEKMGGDVRSMRSNFFEGKEMRHIIGGVANSGPEVSALLENTQNLLPQLTKVSSELVTLVPQLSQTLKETSFTLQGMQRSFIFRGGISELKAEARENSSRSPANAK